MKQLITAPLILLLFAVPAVTQAQVMEEDDYDYDPNDETFMLGPRVGYYEAEDADDGAWTIGLQARKHFNEWFGMELALTYRTSSEVTGNLDPASPGSETLEAGFVPLTASGLLYLPVSEHIWPYAIAGVGAYYTFFNPQDFGDQYIGDNAFEGEFNFGYHLGFGIEVPLSNDLALNADYRFVFVDPVDELPEEELGDFNGHSITFSLMWYL